MPRRFIASICGLGLLFCASPAGPSARNLKSETAALPGSAPQIKLRASRTSSLDLEVSGDVSGLVPGATGYLSREQLLSLPQESYTVSDDPNFKSPVQISGVPLDVLAAQLSASPQTDLVIALCNDKYRGNYPRAYLAAHRPILVLRINGEDPESWPKDPTGQGFSMGPYLISHARLWPDHQIQVSAREFEPQIPWGVVRIEFREEAKTFGAIAPRGPDAQSKSVQDGYDMARQNCFRCHNMGDEGGEKAQRSWQQLAVWAAASPEYFSAYIRDPKSKNPRAQMPALPQYDDSNLQALTAYFRTFHPQEKP